MATRMILKSSAIARATQLRASPTASLRCSPSIVRVHGRRSMLVRAEGDFDTFLMDVANQFEKSDKKVPVVGWSVAAFFGVVTAEWFIHLPLFDFLLGFPIQLLGLATAVNLGLRYYIDKQGEPMDDFKGLVNNVVKRLPGL